jgi:Holliday junction resolvasome RuvABC endonuclease subunit
MQIPVLGMDPSLRNWGLASGMLDISNGNFVLNRLDLVQPQDIKSKQVRVNSNDLWLSEQLMRGIMPHALRAKAIFVEVPVGSQNARSMASYGICVALLGALRAKEIQLIEVTATEVKVAMTGKKDATKEQMIAAATHAYRGATWPMHQGKYAAKCEHLADALGAIHAGVRTPVFKNLMQLITAART